MVLKKNIKIDIILGSMFGTSRRSLVSSLLSFSTAMNKGVFSNFSDFLLIKANLKYF